MDVSTEIVLVLVSYIIGIETVPPEACFANFRWDDCGQAPVPVMYYWKPGSRCEVGLWRGCLPNLNMFQDEYECVATCIFTARAGDEDYHKLYASVEDESISGQTTVASRDENCTDVATGQTLVTGSDATGGTAGSEDTKATDLSPTGASEAVTGETVTGQAVTGEAVTGEAVTGEAVTGETVTVTTG